MGTAIFKNEYARTHEVQCIAHGTLLNVMWQPGWEGEYGGEWKHVYYGWGSSLFTGNYHRIANQLYLNSK